jgi:hypothetical protein
LPQLANITIQHLSQAGDNRFGRYGLAVDHSQQLSQIHLDEVTYLLNVDLSSRTKGYDMFREFRYQARFHLGWSLDWVF